MGCQRAHEPHGESGDTPAGTLERGGRKQRPEATAGREREPTGEAHTGAPGPASSDKDQTLLGDLAIPTRGFTADVSVFEGTPPAKPWNWKVGLNRAGAPGGGRRAEPAGGEPRLPHAANCIGVSDIA